MGPNAQFRVTKERLTERALLVTALAALAGYMVLAWSVLHKVRADRRDGK